MENTRYLITAFNDKLAQKGVRPSFFVRNYGCQMNERDAEKLRALFIQLGYEAAETQETADLILYNTCCVRESAEDKIWGHLSRLKTIKATKKELFIVVCGCMTQQPEVAAVFKKKHPYVNVVCGTGNRHRLPDMLWQAMETGKQVVDISEDDALPELADVPVTTREYPHKAGVNIMYGCDNYCTFCIVPYVRGRERSRPAGEVLAEVRALINDGVKEIMLLGQNVNAYQSTDGVDFPALLKQVHDVPGLVRLRFMTSHPKDFSDALIKAVANLPKVCKSVHLPLQSGSTRVLNEMNRKYTQAKYLTLCEKLITAIPGIGITTDIIVGYPGETDADFEATLDVVRQVQFSGAFTFIYSKRSGTPAAERTDTVPRKTANERFEGLTATLYPLMQKRNEKLITQTVTVMMESDGKGRTDDNTLVHVNVPEGTHLTPGDLADVCIHSARSFYVNGDFICLN